VIRLGKKRSGGEARRGRRAMPPWPLQEQAAVLTPPAECTLPHPCRAEVEPSRGRGDGVGGPNAEYAMALMLAPERGGGHPGGWRAIPTASTARQRGGGLRSIGPEQSWRGRGPRVLTQEIGVYPVNNAHRFFEPIERSGGDRPTAN